MTHPRVSVVMPTYDKAPYLERTLASWVQQRAQDYELIIVDDGSTDHTSEIIANYAGVLPIRSVRTGNRGRSAARNHALEIALGDVLVFCDDDRVVPPGFLEAHLECFGGNGAPPLVFGWQYGLLTELRASQPLPRTTLARLAEARPGLASDLAERLARGETIELVGVAELKAGLMATIEAHAVPERFFENHVAPAYETFGEEIWRHRFCWTYGASGNMSVERHVLQRLGGFEQGFHGWGVEDTELCYRLVRGGCCARLRQSAANYHQNHPRDRERELSDWCSNALIFLAKHEGPEVAIYLRSALRGFTQARRHVASAPPCGSQQRELLLKELTGVEGTLLAREFLSLLRSDTKRRLEYEVARREL